MNTDATDPIHSETQGVAFTDSHKAGQHKLDETVPRKTVQRRIGAIIVFLVPVTAVFMTVIFFIKPEQQPALLRLIFLVAVCCFPALLYYLFIATKKNSLFNEFILNLNRLGLLYPKRLPQELICAGVEREEPREREPRIYTYMQKFEASYGAIPTDLGGLVLEPTNLSQGAMDLRMSDLNPKGFANILTIDTIVPVMLATVLISLGWLITLPPWEGQMVLRKSGYIEMQPTNVSASDSATQKWLTVFTPVTSPERLAFIGAYFFSLQLLFRRFVRRDLRASAYVGVAQRVILAVIGIWVVVEAFQLFPEFGVGDQNRQEGQNEQTLERVL